MDPNDESAELSQTRKVMVEKKDVARLAFVKLRHSTRKGDGEYRSLREPYID